MRHLGEPPVAKLETGVPSAKRFARLGRTSPMDRTALTVRELHSNDSAVTELSAIMCTMAGSALSSIPQSTSSRRFSVVLVCAGQGDVL